MRQEKIKDLPVFPEYEIENPEDNIFIFRSVIHIHKDSEEILKIYLYPLENCYVAKNKIDKELVTKAYLRECFRLSKYLNTSLLDTSFYPLIAILDKREDDFLYRIHYDYP